ncbi:DUF5958 family protein [Hymenobacter wooponensis]|uniref:Uncharacterized protein n=1 Tax=Hymenobacter wooponensis TaxID=1525360 RepID=A0A4Z0MTE6_9BACT|nr:DUF5958 family protein [Hymenobacter wooponensis]TGD82517.1 hypothetical protein EU557_01645 [Hymenobacter wooponensis]
MNSLTPNAIINYTVQQQLSTTWAHQWFIGLSVEEQKSTLVLLDLFVQQSHPTPTMVHMALAAQPSTPFTTPLALLKAHPLKVALTKILTLPTPEYPNAFKALLAVFSIADTYRRTYLCQGQCTHDWHNLPPLLPQTVQ